MSWPTPVTTPAVTVIEIDIVERGKALISGPTFQGVAGTRGTRLYVEMTELDGEGLVEEPLGTTPSRLRHTQAAFEEAARLLANRAGITDYRFAVNDESKLPIA